MPIIEDLLQRLAAFVLTAVWFALPLGIGLVHRADSTAMVDVDDTRLAMAEDRVVVWSPTPLDPLRGDDPDARAPSTGEDPSPEDAGAGGAGSAPTITERVADRVTTGLGGGARSSGPMVRPGYERGRADGAGRDKAKPNCDEPDPRVEKIGDAAWRIDRALVDEYADDREKLFSLGWVFKHEDERGRRDGFTVRGISCGNLLAQVGLRNRDVVHTVNGKKVNTIFQAISAYRKLRRADRIEIEITRRGERKRLVYEMT